MAHNISFTNGKHAFFSRKEIPWHRLGQIVEDALTSEEAIKAAGLDFDVIKCPAYAKFPEGSPERGKLIPSLNATVRTDNWEVLGHVGSRYEVVQNTDAFAFIDGIVGKKLAIFETAGALGKGERIFITAKLPNFIRLKGSDDIIEQYIIISNTHDGSGSVIAGFTPIRVVCNNTLNMAIGRMANKVALRHTKNVHNRLEEAEELLGLYKVYSEEFVEVLQALARKEITQEYKNEFIMDFVFTPSERTIIKNEGIHSENISTQKKNTLSSLNTYMDYGPGQDGHKGSRLWLYNGVTSYLSNGKDYPSAEARFINLIEGTSHKKTQQAFNYLLTDIAQ